MSGGGAVAGPVNHALGSTRTLDHDWVSSTRSFSRKPANTGGGVIGTMFRSSGGRWLEGRWLVAAILTGLFALVLLVLGTAELRYQRQDVSRRVERTLEVVARAASVETDVT